MPPELVQLRPVYEAAQSVVRAKQLVSSLMKLQLAGVVHAAVSWHEPVKQPLNSDGT